MSLLTRELDKKGQPTWNYETTLETLAESLFDEECSIFLGAGASIDSEERSLPTGEGLSKILSDKCKLEWHKHIPLPTIAFYYEFFFNRDKLNRLLEERIADKKIKPSQSIRRLIDIIKILEDNQKQIFVFTTNYDQHFELAYKDVFKRDPGVIIYKGATVPNSSNESLHEGIKNPAFWYPDKNTNTYLYKIHGCISRATEQNLVITEEDYINFLTNATNGNFEQRRLLTYAQGRFTECKILFIGYSLADWNFRVIFKATAEKSPDKLKESFAVQFRDPAKHQKKDFEQAGWEALIKFWGKKNIDIINAKASDFLKDLLGFVKKKAAQEEEIRIQAST